MLRLRHNSQTYSVRFGDSCRTARYISVSDRSEFLFSVSNIKVNNSAAALRDATPPHFSLSHTHFFDIAYCDAACFSDDDLYSGICYYLRKTTLFLYYVMYDEQGILCSHRLEAYHIDTLTSERMRLRRLFSSEDATSAPEKLVLLFSRRRPKYDELPQWKWIRLHRRTRRVIPMLASAADLSNEIGRSLYEQWGPMQTELPEWDT